MRKLMLLCCLLLLTYTTAHGQDDLQLSASNVPALTLIAELRSPNVTAVAWSPDSAVLAAAIYPRETPDESTGGYRPPVAYQGQNILLYETANLAALPEAFPSGGIVENLAFSPDGKYLAGAVYISAARQAQLRLWEQVNGGYIPVELPTVVPAVNIAFSPDSRLLAYLDDDGWSGIWNVAEGRAESGRQVNVGSSESIAFTGENEIAFMGIMSNIYLWGVDDNAARLELSRNPPTSGGGGGERPNRMTVNTERELIAYHHYDRTLKLTDLQTGNEIASIPLTNPDTNFFSAMFNANGTLLATTNTTNQVELWDVVAIQQRAAGEPSAQALAASIPVDGAVKTAFSPDGTVLAVRSVNAPYLRLYSLQGKLPTPEQARSLSNMNLVAYCDSLGEAAPTVASGQTIGVVWSWYATTFDLLRDHLFAAQYEVTLDGTSLAGWSLVTQVENSTVDSGYPTMYWYTPLGQTLAAGEHTISYELTWTEAISDGLQEYGPETERLTENGTCAFSVQ
ncbi:MAG: WD40 repeat domain-containing protein [Anaerolineae bacterium]|nr:WD40 repeat domain-containing protein [Anaerolineae bacterium]